MLLHINGEQREFPDSLTVAALVVQLGMKPDRVAVELNLEIVPRTQWEATTLKDGDKLEVVHFVGGGSTGSSLRRKSPTWRPRAVTRTRLWLCPTCGSRRIGKFCPDCGEKKVEPRRFIHRGIFSTHALGEFFHFDSKIFRSFGPVVYQAGISNRRISARLP